MVGMKALDEDLQSLLHDTARRRAWYRAALTYLWSNATQAGNEEHTVGALRGLVGDGRPASMRRVITYMGWYNLDLALCPIWKDPTERVQEMTESAALFYRIAWVLTSAPEREEDVKFLETLRLVPTLRGPKAMRAP